MNNGELARLVRNFCGSFAVDDSPKTLFTTVAGDVLLPHTLLMCDDNNQDDGLGREMNETTDIILAGFKSASWRTIYW
jgi:hypothetical protein